MFIFHSLPTHEMELFCLTTTFLYFLQGLEIYLQEGVILVSLFITYILLLH